MSQNSSSSFYNKPVQVSDEEEQLPTQIESSPVQENAVRQTKGRTGQENDDTWNDLTKTIASLTVTKISGQ